MGLNEFQLLFVIFILTLCFAYPFSIGINFKPELFNSPDSSDSSESSDSSLSASEFSLSEFSLSGSPFPNVHVNHLKANKDEALSTIHLRHHDLKINKQILNHHHHNVLNPLTENEIESEIVRSFPFHSDPHSQPFHQLFNDLNNYHHNDTIIRFNYRNAYDPSTKIINSDSLLSLYDDNDDNDDNNDNVSYNENDLVPWLIHLKKFSPAHLDKLKEYLSTFSVSLGSYTPHNTFTVMGPPTKNFQKFLLKAPHLLWAEPVRPEWKVPHSISKIINPGPNVNNNDKDKDHHIRIHLNVGETKTKNDRAEILTQKIFRHVDSFKNFLKPQVNLFIQHFDQRYIDIQIIHDLNSKPNKYLHIYNDYNNYTSSSALINSSNELLSSSSLLVLLVHLFSLHGWVWWVEHVESKIKILNKFAKRVIQTDSSDTRLFDHGIFGQGQVAALGDTGVDYDSCYFSDSRYRVPVGMGSDGVNMAHRKIVAYRPISDNYDNRNGHGTHVAGTLVGSIDTSKYSPNSTVSQVLGPYNGMAPLARLAFYDFKAADSDNLNVPLDIYNQYYGDSLQYTGASLSSNSWGSSDGNYGSYCIDTDRFVFDKQTYLPVYAAGNYGQDNGFDSISSPGISKNALTVGSSKSSEESFFESGTLFGITVSAPASLADTYLATPAEFGSKLLDYPITSTSKVYTASPIGACSPLTSFTDGSGVISTTIGDNSNGVPVVIVRRGDCAFTTKASYVLMARASSYTGIVVMLVVTNDDLAPIPMGGSDSTGALISIVAVMVRRTIGENLISYCNGLQQAPIRMAGPIQTIDPDSNENRLSSFSSRGPAFGSRLKPDIVAPGESLMSVRSDGIITSNQCPAQLSQALIAMQGTSMATPAISGSLLLVRQYFTDGFYPSGMAVSSNSFIPTASLLKAVMIHSAVSISGTVTYAPLTPSGTPTGQVTDYTVSPAPSVFQGYGRVMLTNALMFKEDLDAGYNYRPRVFIYDKIPLAGQDGSFTKCYKMSRPSNSNNNKYPYGPEFRATIVWTDPPITSNTDYVLINDLDLTAVLITPNSSSPSLTLYIGNNQLTNSVEYDTNNIHQLWDSVNNVEQISLPTLPLPDTQTIGYMLVHVYGSYVPVGPTQLFSLLVSGSIISEEADPLTCYNAAASSNPNDLFCPNRCSAPFGHCSTTGRCICSSDRTGSDCSMSAPVMPQIDTDKWSISGAVRSTSWSFHILDISSYLKGGIDGSLGLQLTRVSGDGDPDLYVSFPSTNTPSDSLPFPTLRLHGASITDCDSCPNAKPKPLVLTKSRINDVLKSGSKIKIGVYGFCCADSSYTIDAFPYFGPLPQEDDSDDFITSPRIVTVLVIVMIVAFIGLVYFLLKWRRERALQPPTVAVNAPRVYFNGHGHVLGRAPVVSVHQSYPASASASENSYRPPQPTLLSNQDIQLQTLNSNQPSNNSNPSLFSGLGAPGGRTKYAKLTEQEESL